MSLPREGASEGTVGSLDYIARVRIPPPKALPTDRPIPILALSPTDGKNVSKILNVAAAESDKIRISSTFKDFFGMSIATIAMHKPNTKYLMILFTISEKSSKPFIETFI